jgi:hypothetical protein
MRFELPTLNLRKVQVWIQETEPTCHAANAPAPWAARSGAGRRPVVNSPGRRDSWRQLQALHGEAAGADA